MTSTLLTAHTDRLCDSCSAPIQQGHQATWNAGTGEVECLPCSEATSAPSLIVASVARSRSERDAATDAGTREVAHVLHDSDVDAVTPDAVVAVDDDDDATPVNGMVRPVFDESDDDLVADNMAPPMGMPAVPPTSAAHDDEQISPLVPATHEPSVEQNPEALAEQNPIPAPPSAPPGVNGAVAPVSTPVPPPPPIAISVLPAPGVEPAPAPGLTPAAEAAAAFEPVPAIDSSPAVGAAPAVPTPGLPTLPQPGTASVSPGGASAPDGSAGSVTLRARKVPKTRSTIDRLVIASSGIWVLDDRDDDGKVTVVRDRRRTEPKLYIGGKDRSRILRRSNVAVDAVLDQLGQLGDRHVPVMRVFCFSKGVLTGTVDERVVDGVALLDVSEFESAMNSSGPLDGATVARLAEHLGSHFSAA